MNILIDFTHGAAIATALAGRRESDDIQPDAVATYAEGLAQLLSAIRFSGQFGVVCQQDGSTNA